MATSSVKRKSSKPKKVSRRMLPSKKASLSQTKKKDLSESYNEFKQFDGQQYTGMAVGRSHKWYYDKGIWKEKKITPDLWRIDYAVTKRRSGKAPEGSGVPVGTAYHWYILAHQNVKKLTPNNYSTSLAGLKFKIAHKRADKDKWSTSSKTQRKHLITFLKNIVATLEKDPIVFEFEYNGQAHRGEAIAIPETCDDNGVCSQFEVTLDDESVGIIQRGKKEWKMESITDKGLIKSIAHEISIWDN
jgi:hypothetical protein